MPNLLVFNFFEEVIHAGVNLPLIWQDIKLLALSGLLYPKLDDIITPLRYAILGDNAFVFTIPSSGVRVVRASKRNQMSYIPSSAVLASIYMDIHLFILIERQSAEWGIRKLRGPFERLRLSLTAIWKPIIRLF